MKTNLTEPEDYDAVFDFLENNRSDWERLIVDGSIKIKTNQHEVDFTFIDQLLQKFNLRITNVSFTDYYGLVFGIKFIE